LKDIPGVRLCDYENPKLAAGEKEEETTVDAEQEMPLEYSQLPADMDGTLKGSSSDDEDKGPAQLEVIVEID
jgi:hypothetical protein